MRLVSREGRGAAPRDSSRMLNFPTHFAFVT
jgi:hypothetical protein